MQVGQSGRSMDSVIESLQHCHWHLTFTLVGCISTMPRLSRASPA